MKRILLLLTILLFVAAGCNNTPEQTGSVQGESITPNPILNPTPTPTPTPTPNPTPQPQPPPPQTSNCDPNYSGCVPIASDVDCAGGSGNGPAYVRGPVRVLGSDIYGLDRDGDGIACD